MRGPMIITDARKIYDAGIISGRAQEREEYQYQSAKSMLIDGVSDENIIKYSGISPEKLDEIKAEISKAEHN